MDSRIPGKPGRSAANRLVRWALPAPPGVAARRRCHRGFTLVELNLAEIGKDGKSVAPLTANPSRDDIIRANDGAFVGAVSAYDP
jgi:hypothetical protein